MVDPKHMNLRVGEGMHTCNNMADVLNLSEWFRGDASKNNVNTVVMYDSQ